MTKSRLQSLILQRFGQGQGDDYVPWIRVTRGNSPRMSNHVVAVTSTESAPLHLMSALEYGAARVASWLGARAIYSQFPLFPWSGHPHPLESLGARGGKDLPKTKGLLELAAQAGIKHGSYVGAPDLPYVATTDLVVLQGDRGHERLIFWTIKPASTIKAASPGARVLQRIELERLYAESVGGLHVLYDGSQVSSHLLGNLDWLEPTRQERTSMKEQALRTQFVHHFDEQPFSSPVGDRIAHAASAMAIEIEEANKLFRAAAWLTEIDIDLSQPLLMSRPVITGGMSVKRALLKQLTGAEL